MIRKKRSISKVLEARLPDKQQRFQISKQIENHRHSNYNVNIHVGEIILKGFVIHSDVFRADITTSSLVTSDFLAKNKSLYEGKVVLDMGCGSGIQGIVMGLNGAEKITFSDLSEAALENTKANVEKFGLEKKSTIIGGDLFENIEGRFDVIVFNHPFFPAEALEEVPVSRAMLDSGDLIRRFFEQVKGYLNEDGMVIMPFYHLAGTTNNPQVNARKHGYSAIEVFSDDVTYGLQQGRFSIYLISP